MIARLIEVSQEGVFGVRSLKGRISLKRLSSEHLYRSRFNTEVNLGGFQENRIENQGNQQIFALDTLPSKLSKPLCWQTTASPAGSSRN
jgi:hypothetical protein